MKRIMKKSYISSLEHENDCLVKEYKTVLTAKEKKDIVYCPCSINPFRNDPERFYYHKDKDCKLLARWGVMPRPRVMLNPYPHAEGEPLYTPCPICVPKKQE